MATESNQQAGATGPAAPPVTPTRNRHSAGIQVSLLNGAVLELTPKEVDGLGLPTYTSCNEWPPMYGAYQPLRNGKPILTVKGDDGVIWDWRGMREAR